MNARAPSLCLAGMLVVLAADLTSCRTMRFYAQAVRGQMEVLSRAKPIAKVRTAPGTSPELCRQLELTEALRAFAHDVLKVPVHKQFRNYADLQRRFVVWNVFAAPEFSVEAKAWSYPFVGRLKYRGFFTEKAALDEAAMLKERGFDVAVGGVRVYSTLGWFSDPILNTFIHDDELELAETIFHELTHARCFLSGDTDFNEAYATAAAQMGVKQWLRARGDAKALARYENVLREDTRVLELLKSTRAKLRALYAKHGSVPEDELRRAKGRILDEARALHAVTKRHGEVQGTHDGWLGGKLNNARLASLSTYHDLVPAFTRLFHAQGGDWERFHQAVEAMKPLSKFGRREKLQGTP